MIANSKNKAKKTASKGVSAKAAKPLAKPKGGKSSVKLSPKKIVAKGKIQARKPKNLTAKPTKDARSASKKSTAATPIKKMTPTQKGGKPQKSGKISPVAARGKTEVTKTKVVQPKLAPAAIKGAKPAVSSKGDAISNRAPASPAKPLVLTKPEPVSAKSMKPKRSEIVERPAVVSGPPTNPRIVAKIRGLQQNRELRKDFAQIPTSKSVLTPTARPNDMPRDPEKDRLILMVRDPFWLHAFWDITRKSVERAKAALAGNWHTARPILRLLRTDDNSTTSTSENVYKDIEIHGGVRHWYLEIEAPGSTFRILVGYLYGNNRFHELARSNPVTPPIPGSSDSTDDHWADLSKDADRIYALSGGNHDDGGAQELQQVLQEKLKKPVGNPSLMQFGSGAEGSLRRMKNFHLDLDAEMIVFGNTHPSAVLTVGGEPVTVRSDGSYSTRVPLPNSRQVLTVTSKSRDGLDEQTVVIAVERNTKVMEPLSSSEPDE